MPWGISALLKHRMSWRWYKKRAGVIADPKQGNVVQRLTEAKGHRQTG